MPLDPPALPWLSPGSPFPGAECAWDGNSDAPGLLAAGGTLDVPTLRAAYGSGIFPWFSDGQPILWWSPDPRMVLKVASFKLHRSMHKTLQRFVADAACEVRFDTAFSTVIHACANSRRGLQSGTWIVPRMVQAYQQLHTAGSAHSVETWVDGELMGGLYCVALGHAVFGESMFTRAPDASKIALAALVAFCRAKSVEMIDCQQNTAHLASLGASEIRRSDFLAHVNAVKNTPDLNWHFSSLYWNYLSSDSTPST